MEAAKRRVVRSRPLNRDARLGTLASMLQPLSSTWTDWRLMQAQALEDKKEAEAAAAKKQAEVEALAAMVDEPRKAWQVRGLLGM